MQSPVDRGGMEGANFAGSKPMSCKFQVSISISKLGKGRENRWWFKNPWFDTIVRLPGSFVELKMAPQNFIHPHKNCCMLAGQ